MRLVSMITHYPLSLPGIRVAAASRIEPGEGQWAGWGIHVRGPRVILVSPPGWDPKTAKTAWTGPLRKMFDIPREHVTIMWEGGVSDVDGVAKWSPPVGGPVSPERMAQLTGSADTDASVDGTTDIDDEVAPESATPDDIAPEQTSAQPKGKRR